MKKLVKPIATHLAITAITLATLVACGGGGSSGPSFGGVGIAPPPDSNISNAPGDNNGAPNVPNGSAAPDAAAAAVDRSAKPMELPDTIWPSNYKLWFRPDVALKRFQGRADVEIEVLESVDAIVVAAHNLNFAKGRTTLRKVSDPATAIALTPTPQTLGDFVQMRLPTGQIAKGKYLLHMEWDGKIQFSDAEDCPPAELARNPGCSPAAGLFKVGLASPEGVSSDAIVTQGETNLARQWFPGWDEPAFRHTFEITAEVPGDWKTVSNAAQAGQTVALPDGYQRVAFEKTPSMPMYLTFFGGGKFDVVNGVFKSPLDGSDMPLRWFVPPGHTEWTTFAMEWTKVAMDYYYKYTDIPLPFKKFDTIAANDSYNNKTAGFGGMENWGAIFEFADGVLTKPGTKPSSYAVQVVTHEVAHQWFGDLVTLDWWDNVWLNESFATWFEHKTIIKYHPDYYSLSDYVLDKHRVIERDLRATAVPVQRNLNDFGSFQFINPSIFVYNKGGHVLETVENYIGEQSMQKGLQRYLKDYQLGNVTPSRLWTSLEKATDKQVAAIGDSYIRQTGVPLLTVDAQCAGDKTYVSITQEAFPNLNQYPASRWTVPVTLAYGDAMDQRKTFVMDTNATQLELPGCTAVLAGPTGQDYYVTNYSAQSWSDLLGKAQLFASNKALLLNIERDAFRLLSANRITQAQYDQVKGVLNIPAPLLAKVQESDAKVASFDATGKEEFAHPVKQNGLRFQGSMKLRENLSR